MCFEVLGHIVELNMHSDNGIGIFEDGGYFAESINVLYGVRDQYISSEGFFLCVLIVMMKLSF